MPRPRLSVGEIATMQEAILDAAAQLLHEEGFEALTMRAIAERVGVSHMVLYNYFENRDALLGALRERQRARLAMRRESALREAREGDVLVAMRRVLGHFRRMAEHHPRMYRLIWVQPILGGEDAPPHSEGLREDVKHMAEMIRLGVARGCFVERDAEQAALLCIVMVNAPLILYHSGRIDDAALRDRLAEQAVEAAISYLQHS
jgi:AcrR family transcriptional regulator